MIPFEEIDARLRSIGKDRAWLAAAAGRSSGAVRAALAPNAIPKCRSELLQRALSETIEKEERARRAQITLPERVSLEPSAEEFQAWDRASRIAAADSLQSWAVDALNKAAAEWHRRQATTYRNLLPLPPAMVAEDDGEKTSETA